MLKILRKGKKRYLKTSKENFHIVIGSKQIYKFAGNEWYAAEQDDEKILLIDIDAKIGDTLVETKWKKYKNCCSCCTDNGQCLADFTDALVNKYMFKVKEYILPKKLPCSKYAYIWSVPVENFIRQEIGKGAICSVSNDYIGLRTYVEELNTWNYAFFLKPINSNIFFTATAMACYIQKDAIDHIADNGEIVLSANIIATF